MNQSEQIDQLATALAKAQGELRAITADEEADAGKYKYSYATLAGTWDEIREVLSSNELAVIQTTETHERDLSAVVIITTLAHSSGQWIRGHLAIPAGSTPQSIGIAVAYGRRYGLQAIVGAAVSRAEDTADGNIEMGEKELRSKYLGPIKKALDAQDQPGALGLWDELTDNEKRTLFGILDSPAKSKLRTMRAEASGYKPDIPQLKKYLEEAARKGRHEYQIEWSLMDPAAKTHFRANEKPFLDRIEEIVAEVAEENAAVAE